MKVNPCVKTGFVALEQEKKKKMQRKFKVILNNIFFPSAVSVMRYSASSFGFAVSRDTTEMFSAFFFLFHGLFLYMKYCVFSYGKFMESCAKSKMD